MNEIEYILRILLQARDQTAAAFKSAREEMRLFVQAADGHTKKLDAFNASMSKMETNMTSITEKIRDWRAAMQGLSDDNDDSGKSIAKVGKETDAYVKKATVAIKTQEDLKKQTRFLRDEVKNLSKAHEDGAVSTDHATRRYKELERQLEKTSEKMTDSSRKNALAARNEAQAIIESFRRVLSEQKDADAKAVKSAKDAADEKKRIANEANRTLLRAEREAHSEQARMDRDAARERAKIAREDEKEANKAVQYAELRQSANARAERAQGMLAGRGRGDRADPAALHQLRELQGEYKKLASSARSSADEQNHFAREADHVGDTLRRLNRDGEKSNSTFGRIASSFASNRQSISQFDNSIRGIGFLFAAGFAQQLITVLGGLGGALLSVAGSAATAGAALGGIFVAGIAQAIPAIGLLAGAMNQVKGVFQAVKQAQLERQQASVQGQQADKRTAAATDTLTNANEGLADAQRRLKEAQANLTEERGKARRELQDLIAAENQAKLAAIGAALSQKDAQKALIQAQATGNVDAIQRAQLGVLQAQADAHDKVRDSARASQDAQKARAGGVEGMPGVQDAKKGIEDAERSVAKARRGIESAKRTADEAQTGTQSAAQKLNFLLAQMTEGQRALFRALTDLRKVYKEVFDPITDIILGSFTRAARRLIEIIQMPQLISGARKLATTLSQQLDRVFDAFTNDKMIAQFLRIAEAGRKNLAPLSTIIIRFGKALANIAEEAGPALTKLLGFIGDLADKFLKLTGRKKSMTDFFLEGEKHFEAWVNLGLAVLKLFMALTGAGGASEGLKGVEDATKAIDDLTKKVKDNADSVGKFFKDSRHIVDEVIGVVVSLAEELFKAFKPERVDAFAKLLKDVIIPAFGDAIELMGNITSHILEIADSPFGEKLLKGAIAMGVMGKLLSPLLGPIQALVKAFMTLAEVLPVLTPMLEGLSVGAVAGFLGWAIVIAAVVAGFILLLDKLGLLDDAWDAIKGGFNAAWKEIEPSVRDLIKTVEELWDALNESGGVFDNLRPVLKILIDISAVFLRVFGRTIGRILGGFIDMLKGFVKIVQGILTGDFGKILEGLGDIVKGAARAMQASLRGMAELWWEAIKRIGPLIGRGAAAVGRAAYNLAKRGVNRLIGGLKEVYSEIGDWISGVVRRFLRGEGRIAGALARLARSAIHALVETFGGTWGDIRDFLRTLGEKIHSGEHWIVDAFAKLGKTVAKSFIDAITSHIGGGKEIANALIDLFNFLLPDKIGPINLPNNPIKHMAAGGPVPGSGRGDRIPALLEPGEHVWTRAEVAAAGGHEAMYAMRSRFGGGGQSAGRGMADGGAPGGAARLTIDFKGGALDDFVSTWRSFWRVIVNAAKAGSNSVEAQFRDMRVKTSRSTDAMYRAVRSSLQDIQHSFAVRSKALEKNWAELWTSMMKLTYDGLNYIGHEANRALHGFGAKTINFGLTAPPATGKAEGGRIGQKGQRGRDKGLYALGAGEAVLNWGHQAYVEPAMHAYWGFGLDDMFGRTGGFHAGGPEQPGMASGGRAGEEGDSRISRLIAAANAVNAKHLPYVWGGGHQQPAQIGHGMDCSGSVSYVVQHAGYKVPTTTSGNMGSWGFPSGGGGATVFYNPTHTFMRIGNRFFGTTGFGHPGWTGAGWFTQQPGPGYLAGFKQMHLPGIKDVGDFSVALGGELKNLIVKGPDSPFKDFAQKLFDKVTSAANEYISSKAPDVSAGSGQDVDVTAVAAGAGNIFKYFKQHGFTDAQAAAWVGNLQAESGLVPSIVQPNGEGHGLAQWGHGRFDALVSFARQHGKPWTDLGAQLAFIMHELSGPESAAMSAIKGAHSIDEAVDAIGIKYERYGVRGQRNAPAHAAYDQFHGKYAKGGIVPGPAGKAVPVLAHAREWILNEGQVNRIAHLLGVSRDALRSMMGFHGDATSRRGAAGGAEVNVGKVLQIGDSLSEGMEKYLNKVVDKVTSSVKVGMGSDEAFKRLKDKLTSAYKAVIFDVGTNDAHASTLTKNLKKAYAELDKNQQLIVSKVRGGPDAAAKNKAIEAFAKGKGNVSVVEAATAKEVAGDTAQHIHLTAEGYKRRAKKFADAIKKSGDDADKKADGDAAEIVDLTTDEVKKIHNRGLRKWVVQLRKIGRDFLAASVALGDVESWSKSFTDQSKKLAGLSKRITSKLSSGDAEKGLRAFVDAMDKMVGEGGVFEKMRAAIERRTARFARQLIVDGPRARFRVVGSRDAAMAIERTGVTATSIARNAFEEVQRQRPELAAERADIRTSLGQVERQLRRKGLDPKTKQRLEGEQIKLQAMYDDADQRMADNTQALFDAHEAWIAAKLEDQQKEIEKITTKYDRESKVSDRLTRIYTALGQTNLLDGLAQGDIQRTRDYAAALQTKLQGLRSIGTDEANKAADDLEDQIADLNTQVIEMTAQALSASIDRINETATKALARLDVRGRILDALGAVGLDAVAGAAGLTRRGIFQQKAATLGTQRAGLVGQLGVAQAQGNQKAIEDLTDQINDLDATIAENSKALFDARIASVTDSHGFTETMNSLDLQINDLQGTIGGQIDQAKKLEILQRIANDAIVKGNELAALLAEATPGTKTWQDLSIMVKENTKAQLDNTIAINEASGALTQPQGFSSSAWSMFREAIFSGMGQVLPQYDPTMMTSTGGLGSPSVAVTNSSSTGGDVNITLNEVGQPVNLTEVASAVTFASKTAQ